MKEAQSQGDDWGDFTNNSIIEHFVKQTLTWGWGRGGSGGEGGIAHDYIRPCWFKNRSTLHTARSWMRLFVVALPLVMY